MIALSGLLAAASPAAAVTLDFAKLGEMEIDNFGSYANCGVVVRSPGSPDFSFSYYGGISVGANLPNAIDASEVVSFEFNDNGTPLTATQIWYDAAPVIDGDGDGTTTDVLIEAFDAGGLSLGSVASSGDRFEPISSRFGDVPIARVEFTAVDGIRLSRLRYFLPEGTPINVSVTDGPLIEGASYELCGVGFSGSNTLRIGEFRGMRVLGGDIVQPDNFIDSGETLAVALAEPFSGSDALQGFRPWSSIAPQGQLGPRFDIEGFGPPGASLGVVAFESGASIDVSNAFPGESIASFEIQTHSGIPDGLTVGIVTYLTPEPAATLAASAALLAIGGVRATRPRKREKT